MAEQPRQDEYPDPPYAGRGFSMSRCDPAAHIDTSKGQTNGTCAVRYGYMAHVGEFRYSPGTLLSCGAKLVIQTTRGIEIGELISLTCSGCENAISRQKMVDYARESGAPELYQLKSGKVIRAATRQDLIEDERIRQGTRAMLARAAELAKEMNLDMKLVACEHLFGGERIIFHFMAENRIDFREMVRELAHEYHTRIEMRQVGARDEARLLADYEICGRECCCRNFLKKLRQVSMKMAKLQKATLDPSKVSGRCGRLRCCLLYEHQGYDELNRKLPRNGCRVRTEKGIGTVRDRQVLTQLVLVAYDDSGYEETVGIEDLLERDLPKAPPQAKPPEKARENGKVEQREAERGRGRQRRPRQPAKRRETQAERPAQRKDKPPPQESRREQDAKAKEDTSTPGESDGTKRRRRRGRRGRRRRRPSGDKGGNAQNGNASEGRTEKPPRKPENRRREGPNDAPRNSDGAG
jgi:cell fate regulator YaaT (PSP1 superfamily)